MTLRTLRLGGAVIALVGAAFFVFGTEPEPAPHVPNRLDALEQGIDAMIEQLESGILAAERIVPPSGDPTTEKGL